MKKLLLALLAVTSLITIAPKAEAGQYARVYTNYGVAYVPKVALFGQSYASQVYYNNSRCNSYGGYVYRRSCAEPRYVRPVYSSRSCNTYRAPRISFSFGF